MKYTNYLFDWDGTIADSLPLWVETLVLVFEKFGVKTTEREVGEKVITNWNGPKELGVKETEEFFAMAETVLAEKLPKVKLVEGVYELMFEIKKKGGKIAVVTSSKRAWVLPAIRALRLESLVDVLLGKEDIRFGKPDPEIAIKAMNLLGATAKSSVMIGDHVKDVMTGDNAGLETVLYSPARYEKYYGSERLKGLEVGLVVEDYGELMEIWEIKTPLR